MRPTPQTEDEPGLFLDDETGAPPGGRAAGNTSGPGPGTGPDSDLTVAAALPPWRILIVDDDVDVHVVTKFALSAASFQGRRLSYVHAYSAAEALTKLREAPDIALVLLDVIMETADAGLRLARQVREQLGNDLVRIVLRTGQPGQAVEHSIIVDYDINDFWSKADLTTRKLVTTVIAALRSYATLAAAAEQRDTALRHLADAESRLAAARAATPMLTIAADGRITEATPAAGTLLNTDPASILHSNIGALQSLVAADTITAARAALEATNSWSAEATLHFESGPKKIHAAATRQSDGTFTLFASPQP